MYWFGFQTDWFKKSLTKSDSKHHFFAMLTLKNVSIHRMISPYEVMGENLSHINSAPSSFKTGVTNVKSIVVYSR